MKESRKGIAGGAVRKRGKIRRGKVCSLAVGILLAPQLLCAQPARDSGAVNKHDYYGIAVLEIVNGSTVRLENGEILRLIGVETPETERTSKLLVDARQKNIAPEILEVMGREAAVFLRELIGDELIDVEFDEMPRDLYGTLVGYVHINQGKTFVNEEIIKRGYTPLVDSGANIRYRELFERLFRQAHAQSGGVWHQWQQ